MAVESRPTDNPKRDWYIWRKTPNNWQSFFSGSAWAHDPITDEHYLHLFSRKQPDLNWENPEVRDAVYAMMRWWVDRGVDGFRMDVINLVSKDGLDGDAGAVRQRAAGARVLAEMHCEVLAGRALPPSGDARRHRRRRAPLLDPARAEIDMVFTFTRQPGRATADCARCGSPSSRPTSLWQDGSPTPGGTLLYWDNHDQPRIVSRCDDGSTPWRAPRRRHRAAPAARHAPRLPGRGAGMTNAHFTGLDQYRERPVSWAKGRCRGPGGVDGVAVAGGEVARQRPDTGGNTSANAGSPQARPGCRSTPTSPRSTPRRAGTWTRCSSLPAADRAAPGAARRRTGTTAWCPTTSRCSATSARSTARR